MKFPNLYHDQINLTCVSLSQQHSPLLKAFTTQGLSEVTLLLRIQEYCYDNIHFMKSFQKIVLLLYKGRISQRLNLWSFN